MTIPGGQYPWTIPSSRSLIFEVKSTGSELAFIRVLRLGLNNTRLQKTADVLRSLRTSSEDFGNDRLVFKNPGTPRIKISRIYLTKRWQLYVIPMCHLVLYNMCHVMLYKIGHVYNKRYVMLSNILCYITCVMLCYITYVMLCYIT